jgi:hypothetical protein
MFNINTAEKIETIINCFLRDGTTSGTFGTLVVVEMNGRRLLRVEADGKTVIARTDEEGWVVSFCGHIGRGDLYGAASDALSGAGSVSSVASAFAILA